MIAFAELLERLVFTPSRNAKIALLRHYFATQPDPDRGIGLAAITGELAFAPAKPGLIHELAAAETDHWRAAGRRLGAAGEDRTRRDRRRGCGRRGGGVAQPGAALFRPVR